MNGFGKFEVVVNRCVGVVLTLGQQLARAQLDLLEQ